MAAVLNMEAEAADKQILKIMYRKGQSTRQGIEVSLRRAVDSSGKSVNRVLNGSLSRLVKRGNLKKRSLKKGDTYTFVHGRQA